MTLSVEGCGVLRLKFFLTLTVTAAIGALGLSTLSLAQSAQATRSNTPILVELFTSQGCSSCPPADKLAQKLAREEGLVVISRPVDYWDRLGWKDTLARPANTALQRAYARRGLGGYNGVYTPQMVVSGAMGDVGSNERALRASIEAARNLTKSAAMRVQRVEDRGFAVGLAGAATRPAELWLLGVSSEETIAIERGENRGRTVLYTNALIDERRLAKWNGGTHSLAIKDAELRMKGADRYALVLKEPDGGLVLAAQWLTKAL